MPPAAVADMDAAAQPQVIGELRLLHDHRHRRAAGVLVAVGDHGEGPTGPLRLGEEVVAFPIQGAYAAEVVVPTSSVLPKPSALSFEQAGGLMLVVPLPVRDN